MSRTQVRRTGRFTRLAVATATTAALAGAGLTAVTISAPPAAAASSRQNVVNAAESYARAHGYKVGISVLDTRTGALYGGGSHTSGFASESVIKVMIAARLLVQGRMHGSTSTRASRMIRMSDDNIANSFYGSVGGDGLLNWTKKHWNVPSLGTGPIRSGWWGSNRITSDGLVRLYAKLKADRKVGPWLLRAMHGHTKYGADGFYQAFGIPSATTNAAVKQGWGNDYSYSASNASQNSTGFVNGDRYAVAILARGPGSTYGSRIGNAITAIAKRLLPGGTFPSNAPVATALSAKTGPTTGGTRIRIHGRDLTGATRVAFGRTYAKYSVRSSTLIVALVPKHAAGAVHIAVRTRFGSTGPGPLFTYGVPPVVSTLSARSGPTTGSPSLVITGTGLTRTVRIAFGTTYAKSFEVLSSRSVRVVVPAKVAQKVHVRVRTVYGVSPARSNDLYTYVAVNPVARKAPPTTSPPPTSPAPTSPAPATPVTTPSSDAPSSAAPTSDAAGASASAGPVTR